MRKQLHSDQPNGWEQEKLTWPHHETSCFVQAAGIRWHVQRMGQGPPLMLLHGTGASTHSWRDVMPLLSRRYSIIAIDLPGHAFTDHLSSPPPSIEGVSEAVAALLRILRFSPAYCVGHSAGAVILCKMALLQHIRPRRIISVNGAFLPVGGAASHLFAPLARLLANNPALARWVAPRPQRAPAAVRRLIVRTGSTLTEEGIELYVRLARKSQHVAGALRMMGHWRLHDFQASLRELATPMTLIVGSNDLMVPPRQALLVRANVANINVRELEGLGHLAHEERPAWFAEEVAAACESA